MKKILLAVAIAFSMNAVATKIAVVDMETLFADYKRTKQAEEAFKKKTKIFEEYIKGEVENIQKMQKEFIELRDDVAKNIALSEEARKEKQEIAKLKAQRIELKKTELAKYNKAEKGSLMKIYNLTRNKLVKEIQDKIVVHAKAEKIDLILEKSGKTSNGVTSILYSAETLDITNTILEQINK